MVDINRELAYYEKDFETATQDLVIKEREVEALKIRIAKSKREFDYYKKEVAMAEESEKRKSA